MALTLDGRPMSRRTDAAVLRNGRLFVDAVDWTRAFNGLLIFEKNAVRLTVRGHTSAYHVGSRTAFVDRQSWKLRAPPFERSGDIYIPIDTAIAIDGGLKLVWINRRHADLRVGVFQK
ncbi:MAG: stalk domain-containing protein [Polyangiaceae bacterium]